MNIITTRKLLLASALTFICGGTALALDHGSMKGEGLLMHEENNEAIQRTATLDYKLVTIGAKTWAWNKANGTTIDTGADWCSQFRYWSEANAKTENNMLKRNATANLATEVWDVSTKAIPSPVKISFFQNLLGMGNSETSQFAYDPTTQNSKIGGDNTAPTITTATANNVGETTVTLNIVGSDAQSDVFYYVTGNGIEEVVFTSDFELAGLSPSTSYSLTVTPIDFSGNEGVAETVNFSTAGLVQVTSGVAKDIKFVLLSTNGELEYYYEFTNSANTFREAFLKITPAGGSEFEIKPTISADGKYAYGKTNDARIAGKVLSLNLGYFIFAAGEPVWEDYVMENRSITEGTLAGTAIKHQMNGGIALTEKETVAPTLTTVVLDDVTDGYIKLNIDGVDNSGTVYYQITGAKNAVHAFRTGDFYLTDIEAGKVYDLTVVAKDLSGNTSSPISLKAKTTAQRSNIADNLGLNYNSTVTTTSGGELVSILGFDGTKLTLGCTTASTVITNAGWQNRVFNTPTVKVNGVSYPLTLDGNKTTATVVFDGKIGDDENAILLTEGTTLEVQWSVFWGETGGGNFFTGTYTYKIGDEGQEDTEGPAKPVLTVSGTTITWPSCSDLLSGVKYYRITESTAKGAETIIMDLGEPSFSYTMTSASNIATITAVDFAGNETSASTDDTPTSVDEIEAENFTIITDLNSGLVNVEGVTAKQVIVYDLTAKAVLSVQNSNTIDVSALIGGVYIVKVIDTNGVAHSAKLAVR